MVHIAVIGAGLMGIKIAGTMVYYGHSVTLYDSNSDTLEVVPTKFKEDKETMNAENLVATDSFTGELNCVKDLREAVKDVQFVFEAIIEDLSIKQEIFERIGEYCNEETIITSNTLKLDIDEVFGNSKHLQRTMGLRFLHPVYFIPDVEITPNKHTSAYFIDKVSAFLGTMGKHLSYRENDVPLVLTDDQILEYKTGRQQEIKMKSLQKQSTLIDSNKAEYLLKEEVEKAKKSPKAVTESHHLVCLQCNSETRNCMLEPCQHVITCTECSLKLTNQKSCCPLCCKEITHFVQIEDE